MGGAQPEAEGLTGRLPQAVPDRHIFRVGADGHAEPTGTTAPPEPNRAIAPVRNRPQPPAVEPPPPHLRAPEEGARPTKPARRRRSAPAEPVRGGELPGLQIPALPTAAPSIVSERIKQFASFSIRISRPIISSRSDFSMRPLSTVLFAFLIRPSRVSAPGVPMPMLSARAVASCGHCSTHSRRYEPVRRRW